MFKKSLKKSNDKKNNKSLKKDLRENNKSAHKILKLKRILNENIEKIDSITVKLEGILIKENSKENKKKNAKEIQNIVLKIKKDLEKYNIEIITLEENTSLDKKMIDNLNKYIREMNKMGNILDIIIKELNKGFSNKAIEYIKKELDFIGLLLNVLLKVGYIAASTYGFYKIGNAIKKYKNETEDLENGVSKQDKKSKLETKKSSEGAEGAEERAEGAEEEEEEEEVKIF